MPKNNHDKESLSEILWDAVKGGIGLWLVGIPLAILVTILVGFLAHAYLIVWLLLVIPVGIGLKIWIALEDRKLTKK